MQGRQDCALTETRDGGSLGLSHWKDEAATEMARSTERVGLGTARAYLRERGAGRGIKWVTGTKGTNLQLQNKYVTGV